MPISGPAGPRQFHGRGLDAIIPWLEYVRDLGASGLLLGPVFESATHGYDTLDHMHIDVRLGGDAAFDQLVAACRDMGLPGDAGWRVQSREPQSSGRSGGA